MPIPFLIAAGGALFATAIGAEAHHEAKETNEQTIKINRDAQRIYEDAKNNLEISQNKAQEALVKFGNTKEDVINTSISRFVETYEHIKKIQLNSKDEKEISQYIVYAQEVMEMREMAELYKTTIASGLAGGATGAAIALATSGVVPWAASLASAGAVGSAFAVGAAATPLSAVVAPAVFFSGISSAIKADENYEKAKANYEEAKAAVEKMKISQTQCDAIATRTNMLNDLLEKLEKMFSKCTDQLENMVNEKIKLIGRNEIQMEDLSKDELDLVCVTRALAGTVKAVVDTPLLSKNGDLTPKSYEVYENVNKELPRLREDSDRCFVKKKGQSNAEKDEKWEEVRTRLEKVELATGMFGKHIRDIMLKSEDSNILKIQAANEESALFLKQNCDDIIKATVRKVYGCDKEIVYGYTTEIK